MNATATWEHAMFEEGPEEREIRRGLLVTRLAGGAMLLTGLLHGASVLQVALFGYQSFPVIVAELVFVGFTLVHVLAGARAYDGSPIASGIGAAAGFGGAGFAFAWFLWLLGSGVLGLLPLVVVMGGGVCGLLAAASVPFALQVVRARRTLIDG